MKYFFTLFIIFTIFIVSACDEIDGTEYECTCTRADDGLVIAYTHETQQLAQENCEASSQSNIWIDCSVTEK